MPTVVEEDESIEELDAEDLPPLAGYVATTAKEAAKTVMISDSGDPILARWRSGLGRTAAYTSDTKPRWAEDWIRWEDFAKFWAQLVRSVAGQEVGRDVAVEASYEIRDEGFLSAFDHPEVDSVDQKQNPQRSGVGSKGKTCVNSRVQYPAGNNQTFASQTI